MLPIVLYATAAIVEIVIFSTTNAIQTILKKRKSYANNKGRNSIKIVY